MVPRFVTTSSRDMPMPLSITRRTRFSGSTWMRMQSRGSTPSRESSESASTRSLSSASLAFETSSRRKISRFE